MSAPYKATSNRTIHTSTIKHNHLYILNITVKKILITCLNGISLSIETEIVRIYK